MLHSARLKSVTELLEIFFEKKNPADQIFNQYVRNRKYIGSKDRLFIAETFYNILRYYYNLEGFLDSDITSKKILLVYLLMYQDYSIQKIRDSCNNDKYHLETLSIKEESFLKQLSLKKLNKYQELGVNEWIYNKFKENFPDDYVNEIKATQLNANLNLRINTLKNNINDVHKNLNELNIDFENGKFLENAIIIKKRINLNNLEIYKNGFVEVQDEGSQIIAKLVDAEAGMKILDYCAGAGGKTLAIAQDMKNQGNIIATDIVEWRIKRARERLRKNGVHNASCKSLNSCAKWLKRQEGEFDRVLIDVPCSGSGTWRRNPDLKIRITQNDINELEIVQKEILLKTSKFVKIGGRLIYATCSLFKEENQKNIEFFLNNNQNFSLILSKKIWDKVIPLKKYPSDNESFLQLTPYQHSLDGFFVAILERKY